MSVTRLLAAALIVAAIARPASADVTLRLEGRGHMLGTVAEDAVEYRKGLKLRTDSTSNGVSATTIIDLGARRMIMLWHHSKTATVIERNQIAELFSKDDSPVVRPSVTPTTQSRQVAGSTCIVHNVEGTYSMSRMDMVPPTMVTHGTVCLVKNGPGQADYTAFYQAAGKHASLVDPGLGVPFAMEMTISFRGNEPGAAAVGAGTVAMEAISVSTDPIPDSMFEIPADYAVTKR